MVMVKKIFSIKIFIILTAIFIILAVHEKLFDLVFICLLGSSVRSDEGAIKSLALAAVLKYLNPAIYAFPQELGILGWAVFAASSARLLLTNISKTSVSVPLFIFAFVAAALSTFTSHQPAISLLKILVFTVGAAAVIQGSISLRREESMRVRTFLLTLIATISLLSLPTFLYPNVAYNRNGTGFQGILNHPQTFGPVLVPLAVWLLVGLFFRKKEKIVLNIFIVLGLVALMIASQARTSLVTVALCLLSVFFINLKNNNYYKSYSISRAMKLGVFSVFFLAAGILASDKLQTSLMSFIFKRSSSNLDEALSSRAGGVTSQWSYFLEHPIVGNGFGVYSWGSPPEGVTYFMGIPISAPVEKGFLPTAILEEVGVVGAVFFLFFLYKLYSHLRRHRDLRLTGVFASAIFVNIGELVFFSLGGIGAFYWAFIGLSISGDYDE